MALDTQLVDIPLQGGLAEQVDSRLVPMGAWIGLKNCRKNRTAGWGKRFGIKSLTNSYTTVKLGSSSASNIADHKAMGSLGDSLLTTDGNQLYAYSDITGHFQNRSTLPETNTVTKVFPVSLFHETFYGTSTQIRSWDAAASSDGLIHCIYEIIPNSGGTNQIYQIIWDPTTRAVVRGPEYVTDGYAPKVFLVGSTMMLIYSNGGSPAQLFSRFKSTMNGAFSSATGLMNDVYTVVSKYTWDAQACATDKFAIAYESAAGNQTGIYVYKITAGIPAFWDSGNAGLATTNWQAVAISCDLDTGRIWCAISRNAGGTWDVRAMYFNLTSGAVGMTPTLAPTAVMGTFAVADTGLPSKLTIRHIDGDNAFVACNAAEAYPNFPLLVSRIIHISGALTPATQKVVACYQIASRPFLGTDSRYYMWVRDCTYIVGTSPMAGSLFLIDLQCLAGDGPEETQGRVVARGPVRQLMQDTTDFIMCRSTTSSVTIGNDTFMWAPKQEQLNLTKQYPVEVAKATWNDNKNNKIINYGQSAVLQPAQVFDGNKLAELGFHTIPGRPALSNGGAGALSIGTYSYCIVLRFINSRGEVERSSPSAATSITLAGASQVVVYGNIGSFSDKQIPTLTAIPSNEAMVLELYRTLANGQTFYLVAETRLQNYGAITQYSVTDNIADTTAGGKPILYTGSLLPNFCPPNLRSICVWRNRLCGIGADSKTIWISSEFVSGYLPYFNEILNVNFSLNRLTALGIVDDKLIAFTNDNAYLIDGFPADNLGNGNTLIPVSISSDLGCIDERGLLASAEGLIFRSRRSFGLVSRNLQVTEIGQPVQATLDTFPIVSSATYVDRDREARFTLRSSETSVDGTVLVYDTGTSTWSTSDYWDQSSDQAQPAVGASTVINGIWYAGFVSGNIVKEDTSTYADCGRFVGTELASPWMHLGAITSYQRVRRILVSGESKSAHGINISVRKDFKDDEVQNISWTDAQLAAMNRFPIVQLSGHLANQKSNAIRFVVKDTAPTTIPMDDGQGMQFFAMSIQIGQKQGAGKTLPEVQKR